MVIHRSGIGRGLTMADLTQLTALVTGASSAVGAACVRALHRDGASVACTYHRHQAPVDDLCEELNSLRPRSAISVPYDLAVAGSAAEAVEAVGAQWFRLDIVVAAAHVWPVSGPGPREKPLDATPTEDWTRELRSNVEGQAALAAAALPALRRSSNGRYVAIGTSTLRYPVPNAAPYLAVKSALTGLVVGLAWDGGPDAVTANVVNPGWIMDLDQLPHDVREFLEPLHAAHAAKSPLRRLVSADEVAAAVRFLASPEAAGITGICLDVTAGY